VLSISAIKILQNQNKHLQEPVKAEYSEYKIVKVSAALTSSTANITAADSLDMFADSHAKFPGSDKQKLQHQLLQFCVCLWQLQQQIGGIFQTLLTAPFRRQHLPVA